MYPNNKIVISGFLGPGGEENAVWTLQLGAVSVVCSRLEGARRSLLDHLAGRNVIHGLRIGLAADGGHDPVQALPCAAVLPAPGAEIFVGTTVGEQLSFYGRGRRKSEIILAALDKKFAFGFSTMHERSVWELGEGERRCLLLVSQALAGPGSWIMHSPLERLDGARRSSMLEYIKECAARGGLVVAGTAQPAGLLGTRSSLLVLGASGRELIYQGDREAAGQYLARELNAPSNG